MTHKESTNTTAIAVGDGPSFGSINGVIWDQVVILYSRFDGTLVRVNGFWKITIRTLMFVVSQYSMEPYPGQPLRPLEKQAISS